MGVRERYLYSTNPEVSVEQLGEFIANTTVFNEDIWINCKCVSVNEFTKDLAICCGTEIAIQPFHLLPGQEVLCVGHYSYNDMLTCFPDEILKDLVVIDNWVLDDMNYHDLFQDRPIKICGKTYFVEMKDAIPEKASSEGFGECNLDVMIQNAEKQKSEQPVCDQKFITQSLNW